MKKIICTALTLLVFLSAGTVVASAFDFPAGTSANVRYNTERLYQTLSAYPASDNGCCRKGTCFDIAVVFEKNDFGRINQIQFEVSDMGLDLWIRGTVTDNTGRTLFIDACTVGYVMTIREGDATGVLLYGRSGFGAYYPEPWWAFWPSWLQCVLRWIFFGWIWM
ncbi:MAG: hypothetical protein FWB76_05035 [Oscillospiraceae bacterium]|nr:hypothetical protein [Oscillospiraceae bacterium]